MITIFVILYVLKKKKDQTVASTNGPQTQVWYLSYTKLFKQIKGDDFK